MISVVIPVLNEEKALPTTLEHLLRQVGDYEVIAVDGGSTDSTLAILKSHPRIRLLFARKGRATQMNAGANAAKGTWLLFLHADTLLPTGALQRLGALTAGGRIEAGGFRHRFSGDARSLRFISWLDNLRCRATRIVYGDQALFVRRALFQKLGGFPERATMEDVAFGEKLLQVTRPVLLDEAVITDSRKFEQMGIWRSFARVLMILTCYQLKLSTVPKKFFTDVR